MYSRMNIFISTVFFFILFLLSCDNRNSEVSAKAYSGYDNEISNPKISIYQEKHRVIYSIADKLLKNEGEDATLAGKVISNFFNEEGLHVSTLYSDSAIIENFSNNLTAFGNVRVVSDSGYTLLSNRILWNNQYKLVTSKDSVIFTNSFNDTLYGIGFESDIDLTHSKIYKPFGIIKERD